MPPYASKMIAPCAVGHLRVHEIRKAPRRRSGAVQACRARVPVCLDAGTHQPQLGAIALERRAAAGVGLHLHRLVHEPQDARGRQQRQEDEQRNQRRVTVATVGSGGEHLILILGWHLEAVDDEHVGGAASGLQLQP
jgi:hypothetical protein